MSVTPGSETLWLVHSGQKRGISRLASSTMSWNFRSSSSGAGNGMACSLFRLVRDDVERIDQIAAVVGCLDPVDDVDADQRVVVLIGERHDLLDDHPRLPLRDRVTDGFRNQAEQIGRDRLEQQVPDPATEL